MNEEHFIYYDKKMADVNDYETLSLEQLKQRQSIINDYEYIAMDTSDIFQIDVDAKGYDDKLKDYEDMPYYLSLTKGLKHIFVKDNSGIDFVGKRKPLIKNNGKSDIELLCGQMSWCNKNIEINNYDNNMLCNIYKGFNMTFNKQKEINKKIDNIPEELQQKIYNTNNKEIIELMNIINPNRADDYDSWYKIVGALKTENLKDVAMNFSKKSSKYNDNDFEDFYNKQSPMSVGIIYNIAKEDNLTLYKSIINKYKYDGLILRLNDFKTILQLAEKMNKYLGNEMVYCNKKWYVVKNNIWCYNLDPTLTIYKCIEAGFQIALQELNNQINNCEDQEQREQLSKNRAILCDQRTYIDAPSKIGQIIKCLTNMLLDNNFENNLDKLSYRFAFKNGIYDIRDNTFREGLDKSDYITKYIDFDYNKDLYNKEDEKWILDNFYKICNCNVNHREYYFKTISCMLFGTPHKQQKFYFAVGQKAGNGKSTSISALSKIMPCYVKSGCNSQVLESDSNKLHKFLPEYGKYRIIAMEEMKKGKNIDSKSIKLIADGDQIENEVMFGTCNTIKITASGIMNSNHSIHFDDADEGIARRYENLQFNNEFRPDYVDDFEKGQFKSDPNFQDELINKKQTYLKMLFDYGNDIYNNGMPDTPSEFLEERKITMEDNFKFKTFIQDYTIKCENENISKYDLIEMYKLKTENKIDNKSIVDDMKSMNYIYDRNKTCNKHRGVFIGLKFIDNIEDIEDIEI
tara:strand:+ start:333 stop:2561 length:2229 start_codon:yes stop_codon:yes gene_type:complete